MKITDIVPVFVTNIPEQLEEGNLYISKEYECAIHLCACGCGEKAVTDIGKKGWVLIENGDKVSLSPSIGNWTWEKEYHAHYFIKNNKIIWA